MNAYAYIYIYTYKNSHGARNPLAKADNETKAGKHGPRLVKHLRSAVSWPVNLGTQILFWGGEHWLDQIGKP